LLPAVSNVPTNISSVRVFAAIPSGKRTPVGKVANSCTPSRLTLKSLSAQAGVTNSVNKIDI